MPTINKTISIIVPCYNEEEVIAICHDRIRTVFKKMTYQLEIVFINDGSKDKTIYLVKALAEQDKNIKFIDKVFHIEVY